MEKYRPKITLLWVMLYGLEMNRLHYELWWKKYGLAAILVYNISTMAHRFIIQWEKIPTI